MAKVFVCRNRWPEVLKRLSQEHETKIWMGDSTPPREILLAEAPDTEGLITLGGDIIDEELIAAAPKLKVIGNYGVGYSNLPVAALTVRRIPIGFTPHVLSEATADYTFALLLASARRVIEADDYVKGGKWIRPSHGELPGKHVSNATLGIIGLGRIGVQVAKRAKAFNMKVLYYDPSREEELEKLLEIKYIADLHELLAAADFISINTSLNEGSRHLIGAAEFKVMKPTAILVNTSRGPIVDSKALYDALKNERILRAAIDVSDVEPIPMDDSLLKLDNLIITPHIASGVPEVQKRAMEITVENVLSGLRGERLLYCANPIVYNK